MDEISTTVTSTSDGTVTVKLEAWEELCRAAQAKAPIIQKVVHRTPEIQGRDNQTNGVGLMVVGAGIFITGAIKFVIGARQLKAIGIING